MEVIKTTSMTRKKYLEVVRRKARRFAAIKALVENEKAPEQKRYKAAQLLASCTNQMEQMVKDIEGMVDSLLSGV